MGVGGTSEDDRSGRAGATKANAMTTEILLALVASVFTASASVAQRAAAAPAPGELRFSWRLVTYLLRRPVWFVGILCMIAGFVFQLAALHFGDLSFVEPVVASELLFVFAYLALRHRGQVQPRDWAAAAGMAVSLAGFLYLADPTGGSWRHATAADWVLAAAATALAASAAAGLSGVRLPGGRLPTPGRKAALLSVSAGVIWGFVGAVIKELASHVAQGPAAVFSNWSPYVLVLAGAVAMFVVSNAFHAGPLAASQPGLTIMEPLVASLLGVTLFDEQVRHGPLYLGGEAVLLAVLVSSVILLSRSPMIAIAETKTKTGRPGPDGPTPGPVPESVWCSLSPAPPSVPDQPPRR